TGRRIANTSTTVEVKPPGRLFEPRRRQGRLLMDARSRRGAPRAWLKSQASLSMPYDFDIRDVPLQTSAAIQTTVSCPPTRGPRRASQAFRNSVVSDHFLLGNGRRQALL